MRVFVRKTPSGATELAYGGRLIGELTGSRREDAPRFDELTRLLKTQDSDWKSQGRNDVPVVIDGEPGVPWKDVLEVLDRCKENDIARVEFAQALPAAPAEAARGEIPGTLLRVAGAAPGKEPPMARKDTDSDFVSADDKAAEMLDTAVRSTPWWAISLGFHAVVLAALPLIVFTTSLVTDRDEPTVITMLKPKTLLISNPTEAPPGIRAEESNAPVDLTAREEPDVHFPDATLADHPQKDDQHPEDDRVHGLSLLAQCGRARRDRRRLRAPARRPSRQERRDRGRRRRRDGRELRRPERSRPLQPEDAAEADGPAPERGPPRASLARPAPVARRLLALRRLPRRVPGSPVLGEGNSDFDVGVTGLALLGFLGAGYTPQSRSFANHPVTGKRVVPRRYVVRRGLKWLTETRAPTVPSGSRRRDDVQPRDRDPCPCEAYGLTSAVAFRAPAEKAVSFLHTAQNYGLGWRYTPRCGDQRHLRDRVVRHGAQERADVEPRRGAEHPSMERRPGSCA